MANLLPHADIYFPGTSKVMAKLFFRTTLQAVQFKTKSIAPLNHFPISIIYQDALYWQKGKPFLFNNEVSKFAPEEIFCLELTAFRELYKNILITANMIKPDFGEALQDKCTLIDGRGYIMYAFETTGRQLEKKTVDELDLPALENSLNEAMRDENYQAAARIKNKIIARGHVIFESKGKLLIRRPQPN